MSSLRSVHLSVVGIFIAGGSLAMLLGAPAQAVSTYRACTDDAIVRCGAVTESELLEKYDQNTGAVQAIFSHYGINRSDIDGTTSEIEHGTVYQDGRVVVNGETVATSAYSLSRVAFDDSQGNSPRAITIGDTTLYEGPNMDIFLRPTDAYVLMRDGQFYRGVLSSCGNPLMAQPVEKPKPEKPVTPSVQPKPQPQPQPVQPVAQVTPPQPVVKEEVVVELPRTGLSAFLSGSIGAGSIGAASYYWVASRRNLLSALLKK